MLRAIESLRDNDQYNQESIQAMLNNPLCMQVLWALDPLFVENHDIGLDIEEDEEDSGQLVARINGDCEVYGSIYVYESSGLFYYVIILYGIEGLYENKIQITEKNMDAIMKNIKTPVFVGDCINPFGLYLSVCKKVPEMYPPQQIACQKCGNPIEVYRCDEVADLSKDFR